jgi:hypothetical protein
MQAPITAKRVRLGGVTAVLTLDREKGAVVITASKPVQGVLAALKAEELWGVWVEPIADESGALRLLDLQPTHWLRIGGVARAVRAVDTERCVRELYLRGEIKPAYKIIAGVLYETPCHRVLRWTLTPITCS